METTTEPYRDHATGWVCRPADAELAAQVCDAVYAAVRPLVGTHPAAQEIADQAYRTALFRLLNPFTP